jgi:uncharacterized protein YicC (UPF0701 family)
LPGGLRSMTGFGAAHAALGAAHVEVEVRAVNGRHLKVVTRVPDALSGLGTQLEELVRARLTRGAIHLTVRLGGSLEEGGPQIDVALLKRFHATLVVAARELGAEPPRLGEIALLPGVVREDLAHDAQTEAWPVLSTVASQALDALDAMRRREGQGITDDLRQTGRAILDVARETALLADKSDIAEEVQRLRSHVEQLLAALQAEDGPVGRKLEFLAQELLRESNTMASKTHDTSLVQRILAIKLHVERIREQVANVE